MDRLGGSRHVIPTSASLYPSIELRVFYPHSGGQASNRSKLSDAQIKNSESSINSSYGPLPSSNLYTIPCMCLSHAPPRADRAASAAGNGSIHHQFGEIALLCLQPCWFFINIFSFIFRVTVSGSIYDDGSQHGGSNLSPKFQAQNRAGNFTFKKILPELLIAFILDKAVGDSSMPCNEHVAPCRTMTVVTLTVDRCWSAVSGYEHYFVLN
ncbi:hypothetical protein RRG08_065190 [Elysia crispata]|uniref:Uncharacterized protein n=1 Tax=Elysia crispata TaxID=231223 RepID=A0AAE1DKP1_9GAST|nr:hypothetical protein RRG08_065190 [Elysia crispata]